MAGKGIKRRSFYFKMIFSSLLRRRSRMLVALLAVTIGGTVLSGLMTIYYDIPRQMGQEFRSYGANFVLLPSGDSATISSDAVEEAISYIPQDKITGIAPYRYENVKINEQPFMAAGTDLIAARSVSPYWYISGDWPQSNGEVLIGQEVADMIRLVPGSSFTMEGIHSDGANFSAIYRVAGVVQTGGSEEAFIFMSLEDFETVIGGGGMVDVVECSITATSEELERIVAEIEENVETVAPRLVRRVTQSEGSVLIKLQSLVYLVSIVVLLLTMICVATTMMAVVAERRREIGLRKALGAANREIVTEFLGECMVLGGLGGLGGIVLGFLFAQLVSHNVFNRDIAFQPLMIPITLLVSIAVTSLACLLPIRNATDVDPAIVLRGE